MQNYASEELDKALRESGFKKDGHDDYYYRDNGRGGLEKVWADDKWCQSNEDQMRWKEHQNGDRY